jgi:hypothetical protein
MSDDDVNYLSATLELTESVIGETNKLCLTPRFDEPVMELEIDQGEGPLEDRAEVTLNRRQIECMVDFLSAWLARLNTSTGCEAELTED